MNSNRAGHYQLGNWLDSVFSSRVKWQNIKRKYKIDEKLEKKDHIVLMQYIYIYIFYEQIVHWVFNFTKVGNRLSQKKEESKIKWSEENRIERMSIRVLLASRISEPPTPGRSSTPRSISSPSPSPLHLPLGPKQRDALSLLPLPPPLVLFFNLCFSLSISMSAAELPWNPRGRLCFASPHRHGPEARAPAQGAGIQARVPSFHQGRPR